MQTREQGAARSPARTGLSTPPRPCPGPSLTGAPGSRAGRLGGGSPGRADPLPALSGLFGPHVRQGGAGPLGGGTGRGWAAVCRDLRFLGPRVPGPRGAASGLVCIPGESRRGTDRGRDFGTGCAATRARLARPQLPPPPRGGSGRPPGALFQQITAGKAGSLSGRRRRSSRTPGVPVAPGSGEGLAVMGP